MKWFGRKSAEASRRPVLARGWLGWSGAPLGEWPGNYEGQVRAAVLGNPVAQRSVRLVSEAVGGVALMAEGGSAADRERVLGLVRARSAGQALVETLAVHLLLHGNAYVQMAVGADGEVAELRSEEHTSELQSLMRSSYAVFCLK